MDGKDRTIRQVIDTEARTVAIDNVDSRATLAVAVADDNPRFHAGHIVLIYTVSRIFDQVHKLDFTGGVAENRARVRIPFKQLGVLFHRIAIGHIKRCAIRNLPAALIDAGRIENDQFAHPADHDLVAVMFQRIDVFQFHFTVNGSAL